jgi:DNA-binding MarR family transcriptional regulator
MSDTKTIGKAINISQWLLKRLSRMYESGISVKDISEQLELDEKSVKRLLNLLGYASSTD